MRRPLQVASLPALASLVLLTACASREAPVFRTTPAPEAEELDIDGDRAADVRSNRRFAVAHHRAGPPCDRIVTLAATTVRTICLVDADPIRPADEIGLVPDSAKSVLALRLERFDDGTRPLAVLVRRSCPTPATGCRVDEARLAQWRVGAGEVRYHKRLALSADGRRLALIPISRSVRTKGFAPPTPSGTRYSDLRSAGNLMIVDLASGATRDTGLEVFDEQPITWSADGRTLLLVRPETIDRLTPRMREELRGREGDPAGLVPVVESWDVESGATEQLAIGYSPIWSADRRTLIYAPVRRVDVPYYAGDDRTLRSDRSDAYEELDLASGDRRPVALPGLVGPEGPIAFVGPRKVLYWGLPSAASLPLTAPSGSPLVGLRQMMALRVGDLDRYESRTVMYPVDPRAQVGYSTVIDGP